MDAGGRAAQEQLPRHEEHEDFSLVFLHELRVVVVCNIFKLMCMVVCDAHPLMAVLIKPV